MRPVVQHTKKLLFNASCLVRNKTGNISRGVSNQNRYQFWGGFISCSAGEAAIREYGVRLAPFAYSIKTLIVHG